MKLFVGKLSFSTTADSLTDFFANFGPVISAKVITDNYSGRSRGFGFVELEDSLGHNAIEELDGAMLDGREVVVSEARAQVDSRRARSDADSSARRFTH